MLLRKQFRTLETFDGSLIMKMALHLSCNLSPKLIFLPYCDGKINSWIFFSKLNSSDGTQYRIVTFKLTLLFEF